VKKLTALLTLTLSCKRRGKKRKGFNGTPHFNSLPQGERRVREVFFKSFLPIDGEDRGEGEKINSIPHPDPVL
jgi:hypothetical protein